MFFLGWEVGGGGTLGVLGDMVGVDVSVQGLTLAWKGAVCSRDERKQSTLR